MMLARAISREHVADLGLALAPRMQPVSFAGCFGWLHTASDGVAAKTAVLLCPGLRSDGLTGYRSFRQLATSLAQAGYPTLRFDYPGSGDSCDPGAVEYWAAWQRSINIAVDWLREHSGAERVVLCGLRLGATLAAAVAENRADVAGLVLLAPVLQGRSYIRQIAIEANPRHPVLSPGEGVVVHELELSADTVRLVSQVDLRRVMLAPGCRVAVYAETLSPVLSQCAEAWRKCGAEVMCEDLGSLAPMLRTTFMCHEHPADVGRITAWLRESVPALTVPLRTVRVPEAAELRPDGCIETPLRFGAGNNLFGMLCRPSKQVETKLALVICNSGGDPHYALARASVSLARRLALAGIASLRIDFAGLGDSVAPGDAETHLFETDRRPDMVAAIDALAALGFQRFAVQGSCSGAYHALHGALADPRIGALVLVNLPLFQWRAGDPVEFVRYAMHWPAHFLPKLRRKEIWQRLLQGRLDLRKRLKMQVSWLSGKTTAVASRLARALRLPVPQGFAHKAMRRLSQQTKTLFLFSEGDESIATFAQAFGLAVAPPGAIVRIVSGLDHSLTSREMQRVVAKNTVGFLMRALLDK